MDAAPAQPDPRRWVVLGAVAMTALVVTIDSGVLTVAIPTLMRDFDSSLPSVQWVITGYSLVFASLLVIGGRLGDLYGYRRTFVIGAAFFAAGSGLAAVSWSVPTLFVGEAIVEGIGAAMLLPATIAVISTSFAGRERATAFAVWAAVVGVGVALGPVVGGVLTSELSWRWAFGVNLIVAPLGILGVLVFLRPTPRARRRPQLDGLGAVLVSMGLFLLVLGISEGGTYGWWRAIAPVSIGGWQPWPASWLLSPVPVVFAAAALLLTLFVVVERRKERTGGDPLFELGQLRILGFRYGLATTGLLALGQLGQTLLLAVYLQEAQGLSPLATGLWLLPMGVWMSVGARGGAALAHRVGPTETIRIGLPFQLAGVLVLAWVLSPTMTFWQVFLSVTLFGLGLGIANSQLTNVILYDIEESKTGVASGMTSTLRQVGAALGVAIIGTILTVQTVHHTTANIRAANLPAGLEARSLVRLRDYSTNFTPPPGTPPSEAATLTRALEDGMTEGARPALWFAATMVGLSVLMSLRIPRIGQLARPDTPEARTLEMIESFEALEPLEPSRELVRGPPDVPGV
jgi:EmrB/QacA subfamily drug resistance transporter